MAANDSDNNWNWEWLFYLGTNILSMTEEQFWKCTPKKLIGLMKVHKEVNGIKDNENEKIDYIDSIL